MNPLQRTLLAAAFLLITGPAFAGPVVIDFDADGVGNPVAAGTLIDDEFNALGVTVFGNTSRFTGNTAMIFDSANPTGGDWDLGTPNQSFGGPGVGSGGGSNDVSLGKILILSEDLDQNDPDDEAGGGVLSFFFASGVTMKSMGILDIDADEGEAIRLFDLGGTLLDTFTFQQTGDNGFQRIEFGNVANVGRADVIFTGSGAVTDLNFVSVPEPGTLGLLALGALGLTIARRRPARAG